MGNLIYSSPLVVKCSSVRKYFKVFTAFLFFLKLSHHGVGGLPVTFEVKKTSLPGQEYPLAGLALFDEQTKGWRILGHPFVLKFQLRCLLMGAPCDVIGRWLKPRIEKLLLEGKCELCTSSQNKKVNDWVDLFVEKYPEMWRAAMAKYAENLGIPLPSDERRKMIQILGTYP